MTEAVLDALPGFCVGARERLLKRPAASQPQFQCARLNAETGLPLRDRHAPAVELYKDVLALVVVLLKACRPTAIVRFIVPVIVDAVDAVLRRRARTHVGIEICEVVPSLTDLDPAPAIVGELVIGGVDAALADATPDAPFGGFCPPMGSEALHRYLAPEAPARTRPPTSNVETRTGYLVSTVAPEQPLRLPLCGSTGLLDAHQTPVAEASHILDRLHENNMGISLFNVNGWRRP